MELSMAYTLSRNASYTAALSGRYDNIRLFRVQHNPATSPQVQVRAELWRLISLVHAQCLSGQHRLDQRKRCGEEYHERW